MVTDIQMQTLGNLIAPDIQQHGHKKQYQFYIFYFDKESAESGISYNSQH